MLRRRPWIPLSLVLLAVACSDDTVPSAPRATMPTTAASSRPHLLRAPWAAITAPQFSVEGAVPDAAWPGRAGDLALSGLAPLPALVHNASSSAARGVASLGWSHTVGTGANRLLIVGVSIADGGYQATSVTFAGRALARLGARTSNQGGYRIELWYLVNPPSGAGTVQVRLSDEAELVAGAMSLSGVDQTTPFRGFASAGATEGTNPRVTLASQDLDLVVSALSVDGDAQTRTPAAGQTQRWNRLAGDDDVAGTATSSAGAATVTTGWSTSKSGPWALLAASVRPFVPAPLALDSTRASFWAVRGQTRTLQFNYVGAGSPAPFMRLTISDPTFVAGRGSLAMGDSVLVTATVDPTDLMVELQPGGLQFGTPSQLTIWYGGAGGDLNGDGVVDSTDSTIETWLLGMVYRETAGDPWTVIPSTKDLTAKSVTSALQHFSGYAVSW